jgi:TPR repeat protein
MADLINFMVSAAHQGVLIGQYNYGVCLLSGCGVSMNRREASKCFQLIADQGFANTQYCYTLCLLNGHNVPMN